MLSKRPNISQAPGHLSRRRRPLPMAGTRWSSRSPPPAASSGSRRPRRRPRAFAPAARAWFNRAACRIQSFRLLPEVITILPATLEDIPTLRALAHRIWHEYYPGIISGEQIDYMLARMYDATTIRREMANGVAWDLVRSQTEPGSIQAERHGAPHSDAAREPRPWQRAGSESGAPTEPGSIQAERHGAPHSDAARERRPWQRAGSESGAPTEPGSIQAERHGAPHSDAA